MTSKRPRTTLHLLTLVTLISCGQEKFNGGTFKSTAGTLVQKINWFAQGTKHVRVGSSLTLSNDKTFNLKSCECESLGTWTFKNDTLFLKERLPSIGKELKECRLSNYLFKDGKLFRLDYADSEWVECFERINEEN